MSRRIRIDPITRLEGAGRIEILLDESGEVERARFQVLDFKGFETFCRGRAAEEMPTLTQKICGVCPTAHHIASVKALDSALDATPPEAAVRIRELAHYGFLFEDHLLHFLILAGPDFLVPEGTPPWERNLLSVFNGPAGPEARSLFHTRQRVRDLATLLSGGALYPVFGLPGGVSRSVSGKDRKTIHETAEEALSGARLALDLFRRHVLPHPVYREMLHAEHLTHRIYSMGLVNGEGRMNAYDGEVRVVDPDGEILVEFHAADYPDHLEERVVDWSYMKTVHLKAIGWHGYRDGKENGIYRVGPLARLNVCEGLPTPLAQAEAERMFEHLGGRPVHQTMAYHWARLIEVLFAAERMLEIVEDPDLTASAIRNLPKRRSGAGTGVCEAPRGTLFHRYCIDGDGKVEELDLLVATQNNGAAIGMSVEAEARARIQGKGLTREGANRVEMAFRAYDPCLACSAHLLNRSEGGVFHGVCVYDAGEGLVAAY